MDTATFLSFHTQHKHWLKLQTLSQKSTLFSYLPTQGMTGSMEASTVLTLDWVPWVKLQKLHCHPFCVRINPFSPQTADPFLFVYRNNNYVLSAPQQLFLTKLYRNNYVLCCQLLNTNCHPTWTKLSSHLCSDEHGVLVSQRTPALSFFFLYKYVFLNHSTWLPIISCHRIS